MGLNMSKTCGFCSEPCGNEHCVTNELSFEEMIKNGKIPFPRDYGSYDVRNDSCPICGQGKLYQVDRYTDNQSACAGWNHPDYGPVSCISYAEIYVKKDEK